MNYRFWLNYSCACLLLAASSGVAVALGSISWIPSTVTWSMLAIYGTYSAMRLRGRDEKPVIESSPLPELMPLTYNIPGELTHWRLIDDWGNLSDFGSLAKDGDSIDFKKVNAGRWIGAVDTYGFFTRMQPYPQEIRQGQDITLTFDRPEVKVRI